MKRHPLPWTAGEYSLLRRAVETIGPRWKEVAAIVGTRSADACKHTYNNHVVPLMRGEEGGPTVTAKAWRPEVLDKSRISYVTGAAVAEDREFALTIARNELRFKPSTAAPARLYAAPHRTVAGVSAALAVGGGI